MRIEYLLVLLASIAIPFVVSFDRRLDLYNDKKSMLKAIAIPGVFYLLWDVIATARGHWSFNPEYVIGLSVAGLPLEEILFFPTIAFIAIFTWEAVKVLARGRKR